MRGSSRLGFLLANHHRHSHRRGEAGCATGVFAGELDACLIRQEGDRLSVDHEPVEEESAADPGPRFCGEEVGLDLDGGILRSVAQGQVLSVTLIFRLLRTKREWTQFDVVAELQSMAQGLAGIRPVRFIHECLRWMGESVGRILTE